MAIQPTFLLIADIAGYEAVAVFVIRLPFFKKRNAASE